MTCPYLTLDVRICYRSIFNFFKYSTAIKSNVERAEEKQLQRNSEQKYLAIQTKNSDFENNSMLLPSNASPIKIADSSQRKYCYISPVSSSA